MVNKNNNMAISSLRRRAAWFAVLPIALLQLSLAVHQFDHTDDFVDGSCHVCVQLDRVDLAVDHSAEQVPLASIDLLWTKAPPVSVSHDVLRNFDSRAPPRL